MPESVPRNVVAAVIVLAIGLLVLSACGTPVKVVAPPGVRRQARIARAELAPAGWKVTLVLPAFTTRICGGHRAKVGMSVSAIAPGVGAVAPIRHPHMTALLFASPQEAAACLARFAQASANVPQRREGGVLVLHPRSGVQVAATAGRYFVIVSSSGPLAPVRRAAERALGRLGAA